MPLQPRRKTLARYQRCRLTLERWEKNEALGFPPPIFINGKKYDDVDKLDDFDRRMAEAGRAARKAVAGHRAGEAA